MPGIGGLKDLWMDAITANLITRCLYKLCPRWRQTRLQTERKRGSPASVFARSLPLDTFVHVPIVISQRLSRWHCCSLTLAVRACLCKRET